MAYDGPALGAQAGEQKISEIVKAVGFTKFQPVYSNSLQFDISSKALILASVNFIFLKGEYTARQSSPVMKEV